MQEDDRDIITCKMVPIQGKKLKKALYPVKAALASNTMGDWCVLYQKPWIYPQK